jgi:hypothetical protein
LTGTGMGKSPVKGIYALDHRKKLYDLLLVQK